MNCKEVVRRLSEYLDRELEPELERDLVRHLEHCEDCSLIVDTTRKTIDIYCAADPVPLPADVQDRLLRALNAKLGSTR